MTRDAWAMLATAAGRARLLDAGKAGVSAPAPGPEPRLADFVGHALDRKPANGALLSAACVAPFTESPADVESALAEHQNIQDANAAIDGVLRRAAETQSPPPAVDAPPTPGLTDVAARISRHLAGVPDIA